MGPDARFIRKMSQLGRGTSSSGGIPLKGRARVLWLVPWEGFYQTKPHDIKIHHDFFKMIGTSEQKSWILPTPFTNHFPSCVFYPAKTQRANFSRQAQKKFRQGLGGIFARAVQIFLVPGSLRRKLRYFVVELGSFGTCLGNFQRPNPPSSHPKWW